jgi:preprotein translocase subunit SecG
VILGRLFLTLLILLHKGKGGGMSDMFGGGMSSSLGGSSVAERNLDRITVGVALVWFVCDRRASGVLERFAVWPLRPRRSVMAGGNAIRGSASARAPWARPSAARSHLGCFVSFWCSNGHETRPSFSTERVGHPRAVGLPALRLPRRAGPGQPAGTAQGRALQDAPGLREGAALRQVDGAAILDEALGSLRDRGLIQYRGRRSRLAPAPAVPRPLP